jgi:hypothetical protein
MIININYPPEEVAYMGLSLLLSKRDTEMLYLIMGCEAERNLTTTEYLATRMTDAISSALEHKKEMLEEWREKYT